MHMISDSPATFQGGLFLIVGLFVLMDYPLTKRVIMITKKDMMNIESALYLFAISQHTGKRKASSALNISVDTLNKYIESLEEELGVKLLSTSGRGSELTTKGQVIADNASKIRGILNEIYGMTPEKGEVNGEVVVAMNHSIQPLFVSKKLGELYDHYPRLSITAMIIEEDPNMSDLSYDIGISLTEPKMNSDLVLIAQKEIKCGFFASPEYLARHGYPVDFDDMIANYRLVCKYKSYRLQNWKTMEKKANFIAFSSNSNFALNDVIQEGVGIGLMPLRYKDEGLVCLDNIPAKLDLNCYLVARKATKDVPKIRTVLNYYKELISEI